MAFGYFDNVTGFVTRYPHILAGVSLVPIVLYTLGSFLVSHKPGRNPFYKNYKRPREPLVTDQRARDKVLKQGFNVKKIPENVDVIVIGSGMGGLTTANLLARAGKRVLVLEQHDQAGGCCHTFIDKGFEFDVGIHYIGRMNYENLDQYLADQLFEGQLEWTQLEDAFDTVVIGKDPSTANRYPIRTGKEAWKKSLLKQFPEEEAALDKFLEETGKVKMSMLGFVLVKVMPMAIIRTLVSTGAVHLFTNFYKMASRSVKDVLDSVTDNEELKMVLAYNFGDYGTSPSESSILIHSSLFRHFLNGAAYPMGGASELAFHIIPEIERRGGRVLVRAPVSKIIVENGKAVGVTVHRSSGDVDLHAPTIISTAGVITTFKRLLPKEIAMKTDLYQMLHKTIRPGSACMQIFVGLKGTTEELGLNKGQGNTWYYASANVEDKLKDYVSKASESAPDSDAPILFVSFPSAKDPSYQERYPGKSACTVVTFAPWEWFSSWQEKQVKKRGDDYEALKNAIGQRMWEQTVGLFPQLADKVEYFDVGSPVSQNYYLGTMEGETYGLDHNMPRFGDAETASKLRPETDVPGLYIAGQDVFCCGWLGAVYSGLVCASQILNRRLADDLANLRKRERDTMKKSA